MSKITFIALACVLGLTGCSNEIVVRNGPQTLHPAGGTPVRMMPVSAAASVSEVSTVQGSTGTCGAQAFQNLVGGASSATLALNVPSSSRHYGSEEVVATDMPSRLNFVHSGTAVESVLDPASRVVRVFCG